MSETEATLIRRARQGDDAAFQALFDQYAGKLRAQARRHIAPGLRRKLSESDILQEAYLAALQRLPDFEHRGDGSFGRWLAKIVEHKARALVHHYVGTAKRDAAREVSRQARPATKQIAAQAPSPSQAAMAAELKDAAKKALDELPPDYRQVLRLLKEEQLTLAQAAERMQRSVDAVRKLYARALARLAERMGLSRGPQR